ncbi:MAG: hypothetical protein AAGF87_07500 [Bacteroidota bacterium]
MYSPNVIYHVYNQSNQHQYLFHEEAHYTYFTNKICTELLPHTEILCYCLMPTHFHIQLIPKASGLEIEPYQQNQQILHTVFRSLLSSYTKSINRTSGGRGSLFRAKTQYKPAYTDFVPENWEMEEEKPFTHYLPYIKYCFRYIHNNPNKAGLVDNPKEWLYSSAPDYAGLRDLGIYNYELTERLLGIKRMG